MFEIYKTPDFQLPFKEFTFPAGEVSVKLNNNHGYFWLRNENTILARIQNSDDLFKLALLKDALERADDNPINLFLPYVPYARQDRVCDRGESFSLKVFANYLNSLKFNQVTVVDPHSLVTEALIDNVKVITQLDVINKNLEFSKRAAGCILISPDAGANKKTAEVAAFFNHSSFVRADKLRDLTNGKIKETIVYCEDFKGRDVCVIDDICDGGKSFTELAKVCKAKNCGKFVLYVTHGIFSKGIDCLFSEGIDEIFTTNSFGEVPKSRIATCYDDKVNVFDVKKLTL